VLLKIPRHGMNTSIAGRSNLVEHGLSDVDITLMAWIAGFNNLRSNNKAGGAVDLDEFAALRVVIGTGWVGHVDVIHRDNRFTCS
jgi:hypothetical protein